MARPFRAEAEKGRIFDAEHPQPHLVIKIIGAGHDDIVAATR